jgi:ribosomal protein S12 methylthiotransferase accessory factor
MTDYQHIIDTYRRALPPGRLESFALGPIDRLDIAFWMLTFYQDGGSTNAGSGYGHTEQEAEMGAWGELTEVVNAHAAMRRMPREYGSYHTMRRRFGGAGVADPLTLCLDVGSPYTPDLPLEWVPTRRYATNETVWVPTEFVACQNADVEPRPWLITLITNGLGAGLTRDGAIGHGLLELLQRDGNSVNFRALADGTAVGLDQVHDPDTRALLDRLQAAGVDVLVKLASTDFGMVNVYAVGIDREPEAGASPIMALACGEAAHPDREAALRKALFEFAAARSRVAFSHGPIDAVERVTPPTYLHHYLERYNGAGEERRALNAMLDLYPKSLNQMRALLSERVLRVDHTVPFSSLPTLKQPVADRDALAPLVAERLHAAGFDVLVASYTAADSPVQAVKVIVPGLEVETMSYHRIGERNVRRLLNQGSPLVAIGEQPAGFQPVLLPDAAQERLGGRAWFDVAGAERMVGALYALYREPGRHATALIGDGRIAHPDQMM